MQTGQITIGMSERQLLASVRKFILTMYDGDVVYGNQNAPLPKRGVVLTLITKRHISTPSTRYSKDLKAEISSRTYLVSFQLDIMGDDASDKYDILMMLSQNPTSYQIQRQETSLLTLASITPRGNGNFINEQTNYENRYILEMEFTLCDEVTREINFIDNINPIIKEIK